MDLVLEFKIIIGLDEGKALKIDIRSKMSILWVALKRADYDTF